MLRALLINDVFNLMPDTMREDSRCLPQNPKRLCKPQFSDSYIKSDESSFHNHIVVLNYLKSVYSNPIVKSNIFVVVKSAIKDYQSKVWGLEEKL